MSHRFSGRVGALVLGSLAAITACGSRDNLFVQDDEVYTGQQAGTPSFGGSGSTSVGGRAGSVSGASFGGSNTTFGGSSTTFGGSFGLGGQVGVAGSPAGGLHAGGAAGAGFGGTSSKGGAPAFGGSAGFGAVGNFGAFAGAAGATPDWCEACMAQNTGANPCAAFACDLQNFVCAFVLQNDGHACADGNRCDQAICEAGKCVVQSTTICAQSQCMGGVCDPTSGLCNAIPFVGECDDGDPCTLNDQCLNGMCAAGKPVGCQNNDKCCPAGCTSVQDNDCASSTQVVLDATDRGWYQNTGGHTPSSKNTFTGFTMGNSYNSYFNFDLSQVNATITSALVMLHEESYYGTDASETVSVWDTSETAAAISTTSQSALIYQDLQSGNQYGSFITTPNLVGINIAVKLNAKAIADLNAARGTAFTIGLHVDTLSAGTADQGVRFSSDNEPEPNQLILNF